MAVSITAWDVKESIKRKRKAMATITIEVPDEIVNKFESIEAIRRIMYEDFIIEQRQYGNLSLGEAAQ
ncbi:MAG: hypothetical protein ACUZ8O_04600 [Candidatus Anammoxibacter sp.]